MKALVLFCILSPFIAFSQDCKGTKKHIDDFDGTTHIQSISRPFDSHTLRLQKSIFKDGAILYNAYFDANSTSLDIESKTLEVLLDNGENYTFNELRDVKTEAIGVSAGATYRYTARVTLTEKDREVLARHQVKNTV
ncbi:hypothetical protein BWI93_11610 [Siphonobacter sp. BAB-5385]|uniref:hypothetical protein n=1 Tax=Siphonobacter sp. BAB-5385 TaxID=1864822 RepID=UPI000B9E8081|nr:hypothetical protein [Siphonobacter sp. BAB-5385]OZI07995.1 hypothetical protein BWI93_11610 [Siphonobacter sp. BAB-5385]